MVLLSNITIFYYFITILLLVFEHDKLTFLGCFEAFSFVSLPYLYSACSVDVHAHIVNIIFIITFL